MMFYLLKLYYEENINVQVHVMLLRIKLSINIITKISTNIF